MNDAMKTLNNSPLVLASKSPRRRELLEQMGLALRICPADVDETLEPGQGPEEFVRALSVKKAVSIMEKQPAAWVLGADTTVVADRQILGKPGSREEAGEMLSTLANREHSVFTGFTVGCREKDRIKTRMVETRVWFKALSDEEINWYASTDEPYDKAGGYGIQGLGAFLVRKIRGSYSNVVGLPVCEVMETLRELGVIQFYN